MSRIKALTAAGILVAGTGLASIGSLAGLAAGPAVTTNGSDLDADVHAGQAGPQAKADDIETAAENDIDDGAVNDVEAEVTEPAVESASSASGAGDASQAGDSASPETGSSGTP